MIRADRELLARLSALNQLIGQAPVVLLGHLHDGLLPAAGLRELADQLDDVAARLRARAGELENVVDAAPPDRLGIGSA